MRTFERSRQAFWDRYNMRSATTRITTAAHANLRTFCIEQETTIHRILRSFIAFILIRYFKRENVEPSLRYSDAYFIDLVKKLGGVE